MATVVLGNKGIWREKEVERNAYLGWILLQTAQQRVLLHTDTMQRCYYRNETVGTLLNHIHSELHILLFRKNSLSLRIFIKTRHF